MDPVKASRSIPTPFDLAKTYLPHEQNAEQIDLRHDFYDRNKCADMQPAIRSAIAKGVYSLAKLSYPKPLRKNLQRRIYTDLHVVADKPQASNQKACFAAVAVSGDAPAK
jgi:hypothetical protein